MKNVNKRAKETDSPKTPGGISKSLLTPIRRLGLSRVWKKSGTSPFVSPLASSVANCNDNEQVEVKSRKRKLCVDEESENISLSPLVTSNASEDINIISTPPESVTLSDTPSRRVASIRKKNNQFVSPTVEPEKMTPTSTLNKHNNSTVVDKQSSINLSPKTSIKDTVSKAIQNIVSINEIANEDEQITKDITKEDETDSLHDNVVRNTNNQPKSPNNLSKECIVVIQKKILKPTKKEKDLLRCSGKNIDNAMQSQVLFDSDSDDVPLSCINKKIEKENNEILTNDCLNDDNSSSKNVSKLNSKHKLPSNSRKSKTDIPSKSVTQKHTKPDKKVKDVKEKSIDTSQSKVFDDDDDDDFELNNKTILVRKTYDKVSKPSKCRSTGSITQKDIDDIKARIGTKKKLLMAKAMGKDTEELRGLIKKWQKGCQDALMELLELMKKKIPENSHMNYSYILEMLKIPPALVGYDEENECFNTPNDDSILGVNYTQPQC